MTPTRNMSRLVILLLSLIAIHGILSMTGKDSLSSLAETKNSQGNVLGATAGPSYVTIFKHAFYLPQ